MPAISPNLRPQVSSLNEGLLSEEKQYPARPRADRDRPVASTKGFSRKRSNGRRRAGSRSLQQPQRRASLGREAMFPAWLHAMDLLGPQRRASLGREAMFPAWLHAMDLLGPQRRASLGREAMFPAWLHAMDLLGPQRRASLGREAMVSASYGTMIFEAPQRRASLGREAIGSMDAPQAGRADASTKGFSRKRSNPPTGCGCTSRRSLASTKGFSRKRSNRRWAKPSPTESSSLNEGLLSEEKQ